MNEVTFRPLQREDMLTIMQWRNEQMAVLRQTKPLTEKEQLDYFDQVVAKNRDLILLAMCEKDQLIGYGGLTHISWQSKRAEVSFLLETNKSPYPAYFTLFLDHIKKLSFQTYNLHRLYTETFDLRPAHIATLESNGFLLEGRMKEHVLIEGKYRDSLIHGCVNA